MSKIVVASNRLPVTLRPERDKLDLAKKALHEREAHVKRLREKCEELEEAIAWHSPKSTAAGETVPADIADEAPSKYFTYFDLQKAFKAIEVTLGGKTPAEDLVSEAKWKGWVGQVWKNRESAPPVESSEDSNIELSDMAVGRVFSNEFTFEIFAGAKKADAVLQEALSYYAGAQEAWAALHGSRPEQVAALGRKMEVAELLAVVAREELESETREPSVPITASSGGLVSAMRSVAEGTGLVWVGWPGTCVAEEKHERYARALEEQHGYVPIYMSDDEANDFYTGFSNSSLWPLLHWMTPYAHYSEAWAAAYRRVNERFAVAVFDRVEKEAVSLTKERLVWIHDYHLLLVPRMLCERAAGRHDIDLKVAFFLHTPFPSSEVMCCHPNCRELLQGMLGADLIGFHTYGYLRHFRSTVMRMFGYPTETDCIDHNGKRTKLGVFPIGVDAHGIREAMASKEFEKHLKNYAYTDQALVLSVERLDYSKGLPQKLEAIRRFLQITHKRESDHATAAEMDFEKERNILQRVGAGFMNWWKGKKQALVWGPHNTVFLFIAVPSRQEVQEYKAIEDKVQQMISQINGDFSTPNHQPIVYVHRSVPLEELCALYARADCCLVTPLIDGMNLVAKEYVAAKDETTPGVVPGLTVLSEWAGAAQEMFDALVVNPHDVEKVAKTIIMALEMPRDVRWQLTSEMRGAVVRNDASKWAKRLMKELVGVNERVIMRDRATSIITKGLLSMACHDHGHQCFLTSGDWAACGLKNQVRPGLELIEVAGKPLAGAPTSVEEVVDLITKAPSEAVLLAFRSPRDRIFARSASRCEPLVDHAVAKDFSRSAPGKKALFLDYDGTLRAFEARPEDAVPDDKLYEILHLLNSRSDLDVCIVSGRNKEFMEYYFDTFPNITLVAEHGFLISRPRADETRQFDVLNVHTRIDWMDKVIPIMKLFAANTPGSKVEVKTSAVVWHYRNVDPEYGEFKAKELAHTLWQSLANLACEVSRGQMIVEVSSLQVKKGLVVKHFLDTARDAGQPYSAVLCVGDDRTDETMFQYAQEEGKRLQEKFVSVKVGKGQTYADYTLKDPAAVIKFLRLIVTEDTGGRDRMDHEELLSPSAKGSDIDSLPDEV